MPARDDARDRPRTRSGQRGRDYGDDGDGDGDASWEEAPWLAPAGAAPRTRVSRRSLFWTALLLLSLAAVAAVGLVLLLSKKDSGSTQGYMNAEQAPLISAEPGPYKIPPIDPKGLAVEGQDQTIYQAGEGIDTGSTIDMSAMPEQPMPRPGTAPGLPRDLVPDAMNGAPALPPAGIVPPAVGTPGAAPRPLAPATAPAIAPAATAKPPAVAVTTKPPAPAATTKPQPTSQPATAPRPAPAVAAVPAPARPAPTTVPPPPPRKSGTAQLGAFSSEAKANAAWTMLAARHAGFAGFAKRLVPVESNGQTLWRLRASGGDAAALCASLKAGGFACTVIE